jgi:hypothetical protein
MARARSLKPGFFKNDALAELGPHAQLLFAGLWTLADREGRLEDRPLRIRAEIFPYDMSVDTNTLLDGMAAAGMIIRYQKNGGRFIAIPTWHKHQNPHHMEAASEIPAPDGMENRYNHTPIYPKQRARILDRDNRQCVICKSKSELQIDHVNPVCNGGTSVDNNLRTLCAQCNNKLSKRRPPQVSPQIKRADSGLLTPDSLNPLPVVEVQSVGAPPHSTEISDDDPISPGENILPGSINKPYTDSGQALDQLARDLVNRLMAKHWTASNGPTATGRLERILAEAVHPERTAAAIEANHASWAAWHMANRKERKKRLEYWLADGDYLHPVSGYSAPAVPVIDEAPVVSEELSDDEIARLDRERVQGKLQEALR